jgi:gas vesicle protein
MGKLTKTLTFGAILGFVAGLLFAPGKGEESRKKVSEAIEKGKEKIEEIKNNWMKKEG